MKLETKRRLSMLLLAVAVIFWLLRQLAVVYIPGVSALALAGGHAPAGLRHGPQPLRPEGRRDPDLRLRPAEHPFRHHRAVRLFPRMTPACPGLSRLVSACPSLPQFVTFS